MKKISIVLLSLLTSALYAQVAIGKASISNSSVSLEFYDSADNKKAIIVPWVDNTNTMTNVSPGTIVYDTQDKKVKYYKNNVWFDWSVDPTGTVNTILQDAVTEQNDSKVQIGGNPSTDTTIGILVLADTNKAMILPKVADPHLTIVNPEPGTMVYDTTSKLLAVYNGTVWSFWKD